ncbi:MAG TPA: hypothetical protein VEW94_13160, partial [Chloroflexia bacterium]|nr:hypothetical protein [Chloroflexia bacterium]
NVMPVTRDLSPSKRATILRWLNETGPDGKPLLGTPPPSLMADTAVAVEPAPPSEDTIQKHLMGGKAAALNRRLALRSANDKP